MLKKYGLLILVCLCIVLVFGVRYFWQNSQDFPSNIAITTGEDEPLIYRNTAIGFQITFPQERNGIIASEDRDFTTFSLPSSEDPEFSRQILRIHYGKDENLGYGDVEITIIGHNEIYTFSTYFSPDEQLFQEYLFSRKYFDMETRLISGGNFTTFTPTPPNIPVESFIPISGLDFLYRNETYGFQLSFPDAFKNAKIYTIPRYNDRFHDSRYDFDMVIIKLKDVYASLGEQGIIVISIAPATQQEKRGFKEREYFRETMHNNAYYFSIGFTNMGREGIKDFFPDYDKEKYKADSMCRDIDYGENEVFGIGCRLENIVTKGFEVFDV